MKMNTRLILASGLAVGLALTAVACSDPTPEAPRSTVVAYEGATLITGDGGPPLGGGVLVVDQGGKLAARPGADHLCAVPGRRNHRNLDSRAHRTLDRGG